MPSIGEKHDDGKLRFSLIPPEATRALAKVLTFGAEKYGPNNWQVLEDAESRYMDALYRHLEAHRAGDVLDDESKMPHLWHAITNISFLIYFQQQPAPVCMEPKIATPGELEKIKEAISTGISENLVSGKFDMEMPSAASDKLLQINGTKAQKSTRRDA